MRSDVWQCERCFGLNAKPGACRVCSRRRILAVANEPLARPPRRRRLKPAAWFAPAVFVSLSLVFASRFEPSAAGSSITVLRAMDPDQVLLQRRAELTEATTALSGLLDELDASFSGTPLPRRWRARLDEARFVWELDGYTGLGELAEPEVTLRALMLELASLHHRWTVGALGVDVPARVAHARAELDRVTSELSHAP